MSDAETPTGSSQSESHRLKLTPEQRRVLGPARTRQDWQASTAGSAPASAPPAISRPPSSAPRGSVVEEKPAPAAVPRQKRARFGQIFQAQNVALGFAALVALFGVFYFGKKFDYLRYELLTRLRAPKPPSMPDKFPNLSADELVEQSLIDERLHNWRQAAEKLIAAKHKNLGYPELLFRAAKLYYENNEFDLADALFERSIAFRESVGDANYYRGMIANGRGDFAAAQQFFDAASAADPFAANFLYSAAEALRRQHRPAEAITRYQRAAFRSPDSEENVCRFKTRISSIEAGDAAKVADELEKRMAAGPLTTDWYMVQAALALQTGRYEDAVAAIKRARETDTSFLRGYFAACAGDRFFVDAAMKYPQLAELLMLDR